VNTAALPAINLGNDTVACQGTTILLNATSIGATYIWQDGSTAPVYNVLQSGNYFVSASTNCGTVRDSISVSMIPLINISLGNDTTLCMGTTLQLNVETTGATYLWQDSSQGPAITIDKEGTYFVRVTSACNTSSDTITTILEDCSCDLFIPNSFSPNSDGINDYFHPFSSCIPSSYNLIIFNRWGEKVFNTDEFEIGWDGIYKNKPASDDLYVFLLQYNFRNGVLQNKKGSVTLIR
jgi:gliding motility-associated-like protein